MKFKSGDKFIYAGDFETKFLYLEFISERGANLFMQKIYYSDGRVANESVGDLSVFISNIEDGVWVPSTPLTPELM